MKDFEGVKGRLFMCLLIFRFGECFPLFFVVDDGEENCENLYHFGSKLDMLVTTYIFLQQTLELIDKVVFKLHGEALCDI